MGPQENAICKAEFDAFTGKTNVEVEDKTIGVVTETEEKVKQTMAKPNKVRVPAPETSFLEVTPLDPTPTTATILPDQIDGFAVLSRKKKVTSLTRPLKMKCEEKTRYVKKAMSYKNTGWYGQVYPEPVVEWIPVNYTSCYDARN